jgi:putative nucleotidyltransferase with HDIG domain
MALLFFLCAGFPLAGLAALTITSTTRVLDSEATDRLRYDARMVTQEVLGRLNALVSGLDSVVRHATDDHPLESPADKDAGSYFSAVPSAVAVRLADGATRRLAGALAFPALSAEHLRHLSDWGRIMVPDAEHPDRLVLVVGSGNLAEPHAAAVVDERSVFGFDDAEALPPDSSACLARPNQRPVCSDGALTPLVGTLIDEGSISAATLDTPSGVHAAWVTDLSLDAHYNTASWTFVLLRPQSVIRAPISAFVRNLLLVMVLGALVVGLVSLQQVRRQLRPLEALTAATARLERRDFDEPVSVSSGDEFEVLAGAFNTMRDRLRQQFADLEAFNIGTLTTLARAIDAKSPWTAGHSERVTADALRIAAAMRLPALEVDQIRKGGLVHDIGKLATPPEILDKPSRLTPDEERIMQLHPEQGVHILDPIPSFRAVLPIVGQHHERWDGTGYPQRLSGLDIARTARVLAVADVYDALRSDRPYRAGMPHGRVVTIIREGSGSHFDPAVVQAFLEIEAAIDRARPAAAAAKAS